MKIRDRFVRMSLAAACATAIAAWGCRAKPAPSSDANQDAPQPVPGDAPQNPPTNTTPAPPQAAPKRPNGTVTSGGGLIYGNRMNPWFLPGQESPTWCSVIDAENFGVPKDIVDRIIADVLQSWNVTLDVKFNQLPTCDGTADLKFYLGVAPQTQQEARESLENIFNETSEDIAGLTVRTEYDEKTMRGRGFIYIAPETGPLSLQRPEFMERPWQWFGHKILRVAISHEVGHVFGLQHSRGDTDVMGARVIESLLNKANLKWMPVSDSVRKAFNQKLDSYSPRNLVTLPGNAKFTRCDNDGCSRLMFMVQDDKEIYLHIWKWIPSEMPAHIMENARLDEAVTLRVTSIGLEPLASIVADGKSVPLIHATRVTASGRLSDGKTVLVDWTASRTPRVMAVAGGEMHVLLE